MRPACFCFFYYLFFLPEPVSNTRESCRFFSVDFLPLCTSRMIIKIFFLGCIKYLYIRPFLFQLITLFLTLKNCLILFIEPVVILFQAWIFFCEYERLWLRWSFYFYK